MVVAERSEREEGERRVAQRGGFGVDMSHREGCETFQTCKKAHLLQDGTSLSGSARRKERRSKRGEGDARTRTARL